MKFFLILAALACAYAEFIPFELFNHPTAAVEAENSGFDEEGHKLYQGDMILDPEQLEELESPVDTRKGKHEDKYRWPKAKVPYRLDASSNVDHDAILSAIQHWEASSCIQFDKVAATYNGPHLIFKRLDGCYSHTGRVEANQGQVISIGPKCAKFGTIVHEIGHALGFYHEQTRPDRDDYVVVLKDNIIPREIGNFRKENIVSDYGIAYDLGSIMHYGVDTFTRNGKNTLVTKDPLKHFLIGQREGLSFADIKLANLFYKCGEKCGSSVNCNDGFVDKNCRCVCPPGFSGSSCQQGSATPEAELPCGGAVNRPSTIRSPNYPRNYPKDLKCVWVVTAPVGQRVSAHFNNFEMMQKWEEGARCTMDVFEVRAVNLHEGTTYCGAELKGETLTSESNTMVFVFTSRYEWFAGFEIDIDFV